MKLNNLTQENILNLWERFKFNIFINLLFIKFVNMDDIYFETNH